LTEKKSTKNLKKESKQTLSKDVRNIGIKVTPPTKVCENDIHCPFHGNQPLRGRMFTGTVIRSKLPKCVLVEWTWKRKVQKYERYEKRRAKILAHCPTCINVEVGDTVKIMETRKISKTKNFVVIEKSN
jgi:small subunit ribosomal protein S17